MKVIDLLNKIANGEEVPKKIKYDDDVYIHGDNYCYFCEETNEILSQNIYAEFSRLNDEIEIIEENNKIEKLKKNRKIGGCIDGEYFYEELYDTEDIVNKIGELIDKINELDKNNK